MTLVNAVGKIQSAGKESSEELAMPHRPHHRAEACTHATLHLRHEHRWTISRIWNSARSQRNRKARR